MNRHHRPREVDIGGVVYRENDIARDARGELWRLAYYESVTDPDPATKRDRFYWLAFGTEVDWSIDDVPRSTQDPTPPFTKMRLVEETP